MRSSLVFARLGLPILAMLVACSDSGGSGTASGGQDADAADVDAAADATADAADGEGAADGEDVAVDDAVDAACATLGCPCEEDSECESGYCVDHPDGGRVCSEFCDRTCSQDGYECVLLENSGGDAVRLCVPVGNPFCDRCDVAADCGSLQAACVPYADGDRCIVPCGPDGICPAGAVCEAVATDGGTRDYCVPPDGVCEGCVDGDGDRFGLGPGCEGSDPDDNDADTYPGAPELCDGVDNDGDGETDEGFDLDTDVEHCGRCGNACALADGEPACVDGACAIAACEEGTADCDGRFDNGCETDLTDPARCGVCAPQSATPGSACGVCDTGVWTCDADTADVICVGDGGDAALNGCGGCTELSDVPGTPCGACGLDAWTCDGTDAVVCSGETPANACGGCATLAAAPGDPCGTCDAGTFACDGVDALRCDGDPGDAAPDSCATASPLRFGWSTAAETDDLRVRWSPDPVLAPYRTTERTRWVPIEEDEP